jgi:hypothetical protein
MQNDRRFYVYVHRRKSDGSIFYVGKGSGDRLNHHYGKSKWWRSIAKKHGWYAETHINRLLECCAFCIESIIIEANKKDLCNISSGGMGGLSGIPKSQNHIKKVAMAQTGRPKSAATRAAISNRALIRLSDPRNHPRINLITGIWTNIDGTEVVCNHVAMSEVTGLRLESLKKLQSGALRSHKGWTYRAI